MNFALTFVLLVIIGALIGGIVFLSFVLAPTVFKALDAGAASRLLRALFPRYYLFALICCALALVPALTLAFNEASLAAVGCVALIITIAAVSGYCLRLISRINAARDNGPSARFDALHRRSVILNGVNLGSALCAFALATAIAV